MSGLRKGQVVAIPVLARHIETSSGKCVSGEMFSTDCVMADALRDRFPGATGVEVGQGSASFMLGDNYVSLHNQPDMEQSVNAFDDELDKVLRDRLYGQPIDTTALYRAIRARIPLVVHATVGWVEEA